MSEQREWYHGVLGSEFWTVYRGWRVFIRKSPMAWHWSIMRDGVGVGSIESDRPAADGGGELKTFPQPSQGTF